MGTPESLVSQGGCSHWEGHHSKVSWVLARTGSCQQGGSGSHGKGSRWCMTQQRPRGSRGHGTVRDVQPGSSGIGRSASDGASLSVFSSVEPAYGSSPFSPGTGGCLCPLCLATLGDQELWRVNTQGADTQTQGQANLPASILPPQFILGVPGIFCPIVPSFCQ